MHFKIHRGTREIGGSCVEIRTESSRILLDIGMPLVGKDGAAFDFTRHEGAAIDELVQDEILPDLSGCYRNTDLQMDGILVSHAHLDHYGFCTFLHPEMQYYLGKATHRILELNSFFTPQTVTIKNATYFEPDKPFLIGDIEITPFLMDHSAFDAYAFLIEADGKSIFYSGDFRGHGRKGKAFKRFLHHAPKGVDYLLMEGTQIERNTERDKTESDIEHELVDIFSNSDGINLVYTSGQNIDRLVSVYRACKRTDKIFVLDVYTATVLKTLSEFAALPYPSGNFIDLRVFFPFYLCKRLVNENNERLMYQFRHYKITKESVAELANRIVMLVRPSMKLDLGHIPAIDGGNLIYSLWEGYLQNNYTQRFVQYLEGRGVGLHKIHTSGHADIDTLKEMARALAPRFIVPIHTFRGDEYQKHFAAPVRRLQDGEEIVL